MNEKKIKEPLFDREIDCPVCKNAFTTKRIRTSAQIVVKRDEDFCTYYKEENPYFYGVWVCPFCGYAATEGKFEKIRTDDILRIREKITSMWLQRDFGGQRTLDQAIEIHKLAIYEGNILGFEESYLATLSLRLAWFYRYKENKQLEERFLKHALEKYSYAFSNENFPIAGMSSPVLSYLIGVLNKRFENHKDAIKWFQQTIKDPEGYKVRHIITKARNAWQDTMEDYRRIKGNEEELSGDIESDQELKEVDNV